MAPVWWPIRIKSGIERHDVAKFVRGIESFLVKVWAIMSSGASRG
jgi:hypothetical protein